MTDRPDSDVDSATGQVRVFVNYRRNDTRHVAGRLRDLIVARFGKGSVFVDVDSIEPGLDYVTAIDTAVGSCDVMLVLIGDRWLEASDDEDHRRIDDPADRLRIEIESGLRNETGVIPVLVDSASMPTSRDLPTPLVPLARHQSTRLRHESFHNDADHLLGVVERVVGGNAEPTDPRPPSTETDTQRAARWLSFGILLTALLALLALRSGVRDSVVSSRPQLPPDGPWASLVPRCGLPPRSSLWCGGNRIRLRLTSWCWPSCSEASLASWSRCRRPGSMCGSTHGIGSSSHACWSWWRSSCAPSPRASPRSSPRRRPASWTGARSSADRRSGSPFSSQC